MRREGVESCVRTDGQDKPQEAQVRPPPETGGHGTRLAKNKLSISRRTACFYQPRSMFAARFAGRRSERRAPHKTVELDLDTTGSIAGIADSKFSSPRELGGVLAKSTQCQECMVKQYFRYVYGRLETPADRPVIRHVLDDFRKSQFRFPELIISLVRLREAPDQRGLSHVARNHETR